MSDKVRSALEAQGHLALGEDRGLVDITPLILSLVLLEKVTIKRWNKKEDSDLKDGLPTEICNCNDASILFILLNEI